MLLKTIFASICSFPLNEIVLIAFRVKELYQINHKKKTLNGTNTSPIISLYKMETMLEERKEAGGG
jgi:hypothetical protein